MGIKVVVNINIWGKLGTINGVIVGFKTWMVNPGGFINHFNNCGSVITENRGINYKIIITYSVRNKKTRLSGELQWCIRIVVENQEGVPCNGHPRIDYAEIYSNIIIVSWGTRIKIIDDIRPRIKNKEVSTCSTGINIITLSAIKSVCTSSSNQGVITTLTFKQIVIVITLKWVAQEWPSCILNDRFIGAITKTSQSQTIVGNRISLVFVINLGKETASANFIFQCCIPQVNDDRAGGVKCIDCVITASIPNTAVTV